jgi:nitrogen fixation protein NifB
MEHIPDLVLANHPCFNRDVRHRTGRIHLPVAEKCNIQCGFCNRKYDCVNESRPGVTSAVLSPEAALHYLGKVLEKISNIAVVGIAGPGDPFAAPDETLETLRLVRARYPGMLLCVATNGLGLLPYVGELAALQVSHVTVTVNAVNPVIGMKIYEWIRASSRVLRGINGARVLFEHQDAAVKALKAAGVTVKINTVVVPGINDKHTEEIAVWSSKTGADVHNFIPVLPVPGTLFEGVVSPGPAEMAGIRLRAGRYLPQMSHCGRCRADAAGLLGADNAAIIDNLLQEAAGLKTGGGPVSGGLRPEADADTAGRPDFSPSDRKPCIAVATGDGIFVNRHLGRAEVFYIYGKGGEKPELIEIREAPSGGCENRWAALAETLHDCFAVLTAASGWPPKQALAKSGITVYDCEGPIDTTAAALFAKKPLPGGFETVPEFNCSRAAFCEGGASCDIPDPCGGALGKAAKC